MAKMKQPKGEKVPRKYREKVASKKISNWQVLQGKDERSSMRARDVYEDQQLERSQIEEKQSPVSRIIFTVVCSLLVAFLVYAIVGMAQFGAYSIKNSVSSSVSAEKGSSASKLVYDSKDPYNYIAKSDEWDEQGEYPKLVTKYRAKDEDGNPYGPVYDDAKDVPEPEWYSVSKAEYEKYSQTKEGKKAAEMNSIKYWIFVPNLLKVILGLLAGIICFAIMYPLMMRNLEAQNLMNDTSDINQWQNDQHIALPEEVQRKFDWFPDVGAHCNVQVSSMISHVAVSNKGIKPVMMAKRAKQDILDEDGDVEYLKGEILRDDDGNALMEKLPMFDEKFMNDLFDASGVTQKEYRKFYDTRTIPYNPGNENREKQQGYDIVSDFINDDWTIPEYETQRPAGAYLVDVEPVNTMVLAITRAGKGQTVIEPTIDMWTREKRPNNMVINDPKGELLQKFYVPGTYRGFQIVQFNLINPIVTDIYNRVKR